MKSVLSIKRYIYSIWSVSHRSLKSSFWTSTLLLLLLCYIIFCYFSYGMFSVEGSRLQVSAETQWGSTILKTQSIHPSIKYSTHKNKEITFPHPTNLVHNFSSSFSLVPLWLFSFKIIPLLRAWKQRKINAQKEKKS